MMLDAVLTNQLTEPKTYSASSRRVAENLQRLDCAIQSHSRRLSGTSVTEPVISVVSDLFIEIERRSSFRAAIRYALGTHRPGSAPDRLIKRLGEGSAAVGSGVAIGSLVTPSPHFNRDSGAASCKWWDFPGPVE